MKKHIPNLLTCANLSCGVVGVIQAFSGNLFLAASLIWLAGIFDFLDGFAARLLKVSSPIGKQLDSLADMVTFGVLPSIIMYLLIGQNTESEWMPFIAILIAVFSAIRLAKFNIDERQAMGFIGLPTPATAIFVSALPFILGGGGYLAEVSYLLYVLIAVTIVLSLLMVAKLPLMALKFKNYRWASNKLRYGFIVLAVVLIALFQVMAVPLVIFAYLLVSIINNQKAV